MVGTFDVNRSYGLVDSAIAEPHRNAEPDLGLVGIRNSLGEGTVVDLVASSPQIIAAWRDEAARQVLRPEMETGWDPGTGMARTDFDAELARLIRTHPVGYCDLTVFAVGVVYLRIEFGPGLDILFLGGVLACFEFASYRPGIARALRHAAQTKAQEVMIAEESEFARLTERPEPEDRRTSAGYEESTIITSLTGVVRCVDPGDGEQLEGLLRDLEISNETAIPFEYHGVLYYNWANCVLTSRGSTEWTPDDELQRMEQAIRIAHVFQAACDAFLRLFQDEMNAQVDSYVTERGGGRGPGELNKLRTIALSVVNLTNFSRVTQSHEDRRYFELFAMDANLKDTQRLLIESVDVLYNVQEAETQQDRSRRETVLNGIVILLASLTLISVSADAYDFIRDQETIIERRLLRVQLFVEFMLALSVAVAILIWFLTRPPRGRRRR